MNINALATELMIAMVPSGPAVSEYRNFLMIDNTGRICPVVRRNPVITPYPDAVVWLPLPDSFRTPTSDEAMEIAAAISSGDHRLAETLLKELDTRESYPTSEWIDSIAAIVKWQLKYLSPYEVAYGLAGRHIDPNRKGGTIVVTESLARSIVAECAS